MPLKGATQHVPFLRRYARALAGSQDRGDALVSRTLEALLERRLALGDDISPRCALFRAFHRVWRQARGDGVGDSALAADERLQGLAPERRAALLLTLMEGFSNADTAIILEAPISEVDALVKQALNDIDNDLATDVLIIEDEPIIALDLERLVHDLGHKVLGVAQTRDEGVALAARTRPGLVLADVHLADGSSGLDTAIDILGSHDVPVIFITAYPERLLTGERPEPAYLVSKPYEDEQVKAVIGQALFFHRPAEIGTRPELQVQPAV